MPDIFDALRADHEKVLQILAELESSPSVASGATEDQLQARHNLVDQLVVDESKHEAAEEMYFWPAVREHVEDGERLAEQAIAQETEGKQILHKLDGMSPDNADFESLVAGFINAGRAHIAFEQDQVWPPLQAALSGDEAQELGEKFESAKKSAPTRPHPGTPPSPTVLKAGGPVVAATDKLRDAVSDRGAH